MKNRGHCVTSRAGTEKRMTRSISGYLRHTKDARSVRQIHAITTAIVEDPHSSPRLKERSAALTRKLEQVLSLPIASAPFLASIWRDFRALFDLLEWESERLNGSASQHDGKTSALSSRSAIKGAPAGLSEGPHLRTARTQHPAETTRKARKDQLRSKPAD